MILHADRLTKAFGEQRVLSDVSFSVKSGETLAIVGRSGCGKTTLLRILAGFLKPDEGKLLMDGVQSPQPSKDKLMVFQSFDQLFPWFTLCKNIQYALKKTRPDIPAAESKVLAQKCLSEMGLQGAEDKYPYQLSGGMKQRGALARAMALSPKLLLLDEPFASLDIHTREKAHDSLQTLKQATGAAVVLVTHDLGEAVKLSTQIALLKAGQAGFIAEMKNNNDDMIACLREMLRD